jgi:hypothetical protein
MKLRAMRKREPAPAVREHKGEGKAGVSDTAVKGRRYCEYAFRDPRFAAQARPGMTRFRASIHHDLHAVARLDLGMGLEPVEDAEALDRAVDAGHAVRQ